MAQITNENIKSEESYKRAEEAVSTSLLSEKMLISAFVCSNMELMEQEDISDFPNP